MIGNRLIVLVCIGGALLSLLLSIAYGSVLFTIPAVLLFFLTLLLWKYGYLIIPIITKSTNIVEIRDGYEVASTRDYILKKTDKGYYASKFLEIRFYESSLDKDHDGKRFMFESFEKAILSLRNVVKISLLISALDMSKHVDEIKTKRAIAETKRAKLGTGKSDESIKLDREISKWNRDLDRLSKGERAIEVLAHATTTGFGITKDEAVSRMKRQAKEVSTILSSTLGCEIVELSDLDMIKCFEWDKFLPASEEELRDEIF